MVDAAAKAGADAVKFQTFDAASLALPNTRKVAYQSETTPADESHFQMLKQLELSKDHQRLFEHCAKRKIEFISTPMILIARFLNKLGVQKFKIASADIVDLPHNFLSAPEGCDCCHRNGYFRGN